MKLPSRFVSFLFVLCATAATAVADPTVVIEPSTGVIAGWPGATVGWGFQVTGDPVNWVSFIGSQLLFETNPSIGIYSDLIGLQGGPAGGVLAPNTPWQQSYNFASGEGLGQYTIDPFAVTGAENSGTLLLLYESFSADPLTCGGTCLVGSGTLEQPFTIAVSEVPEPRTTGILMLVSMFVVFRRRR